MKKKLLLFLLILISIGAVSHVSAVDNATFMAQDDSGETATQINDGIEPNENLEDSSNTYYLNSTDNIQNAIDSANAGDTIVLNGTFEIKNTINVYKTINIKGSDDGAILKPYSLNYKYTLLFNIDSNASNVVLSDLKFIKGYYPSGGAICWEGNHGIINNCEFSKNVAIGGFGGAIVLTGNNCKITNCIFNDNSATNGGDAGALLIGGDNCQLMNCTFNDNIANNRGGSVVLNGIKNTISDCSFIRSTASQNGGAIVVNGEENKILNTKFKNNKVSNPNNINSTGGGAIFSSCKILEINNCSFYENEARNGTGGAIIVGEYNTVKDSEFLNNSALIARDIYGSSSSIFSNTFTITYDEDETVSINGSSSQSIRFNTFNRIKSSTTVNFDASMVFVYGDTGTIYIYVHGGYVEEENIKVLNHEEAKISFANDTLKVSGLNVGNYILRIITTPDENHTSVERDLNITVKQAVAAISASKLTVALKSSTVWSIKLINSRTNKPISGLYLTLKIYTGSKYVTKKVKTNSKGVASYKTSALSVGTHKIVVSGTDSRYTFKTLTSSIKVIKQTSLKFKLQKRDNGKKFSLLSYMVSDKKTGKGLDNVKLKVLIYTGKKYKTFILKTKKIKGKKKVYHGAVGFQTNDFSAGTHKVKIMPVDLKYKGSVTTYIKILKSATKGVKFFRNV